MRLRWRWQYTALLLVAVPIVWLLLWQANNRAREVEEREAYRVLTTQIAEDKNCLLENGLTGQYEGRLAYSNDGELTILDLQTLAYETRSPVNVMDNPEWNPVDGRYLAFGEFGFRLLDTTSWEVTTFGDGARPSWSPDGREIVYQYGAQPSALYVLNVASSVGRHIPIERRISTSFPTNPSWSPDGSTIAFTMDDVDGNYQIFLVDAFCETSPCPITQLTTAPGQSDSPRWSPDGQRITFTSNRSGFRDWSIYTMNAAGSDVVRVTNDDRYGDFAPVYSPDGFYIAFERTDDRVRGPNGANVFIMDRDGSNLTCVSSRAGSNPDWTYLPATEDIAYAN
jgi:dipeptidyl aminopeptidase/acylaminoacyl peptidase